MIALSLILHESALSIADQSNLRDLFSTGTPVLDAYGNLSSDKCWADGLCQSVNEACQQRLYLVSWVLVTYLCVHISDTNVIVRIPKIVLMTS